MNIKTGQLVQRVKNFVFLLDDMIGKGAAGKVYKGINEKNGQQVAIKVMEMSEIDNEVTQYLLACQKQALSSISNPYVLGAYDIVQTQQQCLIVTPLCNGGTLKDYIKSKGKLNEQEALFIFVKLLRGYQAIRDKGFVHRDLKSQNVMFLNGEPVIIDFGYCEKVKGKKPKVFYNVGSPSYMSPEAYFKTVYSQKSDLWALGIVLYQMLQGHTIDQGLPIQRYFALLAKQGVVFKAQISEEIKKMVKVILSQNPQTRPSIQFLIQKIEMTIFQPNGKILLKQAEKNRQQVFIQKMPTIQRQVYNQQIIQNQQRKIVHQIQNQQQFNSGPKNIYVVEGFDRNIIKMSQSVYRPEHQHQPQHQQQNMVNIVNVVGRQNFENPNPFKINTVQQQKIPQFFNSVPVQQINQVQVQQRQQLNFIPTNPQQQNMKHSMNVSYIQSNQIIQQQPQFRSFIHPSYQQPQIQQQIQVASNNRTTKIDRSKTLNDAHSVLTIDPTRTHPDSFHHENTLHNVKLIQSVHQNEGNQSIRSSLGNQVRMSQINAMNTHYPQFPRQINPGVVQSLIVEPMRIQGSFFQNNNNPNMKIQVPVQRRSIIQNPVYRSIMVPQQQQQQPSFFLNKVQYIQQIPFQLQNNPEHQIIRANPINQSFIQRQSSQQEINNRLSLYKSHESQPQFNSRPLSPVANERKSMPINEFQNQPIFFRTESEMERNFLKKAEPYFHIEFSPPNLMKKNQMIPTNQRPEKQAIIQERQINEFKQIPVVHHLYPAKQQQFLRSTLINKMPETRKSYRIPIVEPIVARGYA